MKKTQNYNLNLPEKHDVVNIDDLNENTQFIDKELNKKADKSYVDSELILKADKSDVDVKLNKKADKSYVDEKIGDIDLTALEDKIDKKADKKYVDDELMLKADVWDLRDKADKSEVGDLSHLKTSDKSNLVNALNELYNTKQDKPIYGVVIDNNNANPETRVEYIDDSIGFKPVRGNNGNTDWGSWKDTYIYEKFKPCVVKNGEVQYYLDREDFTKKEGGGTANLTGTDGDVMIEIDKMWYKLENTGDKIYVRVSDAYQNGFKCLAHTNGDKEVDKIYVGAYLGYEQNGKLRSISGVTPTGDKTIGSFRDLAEANGDRYHQVPFTALTLLQSIMVILLKSTDTQTALGRGHVDDGSSFSKTGNTNKKGMMFGETGGQANSGQMCFMGIEDFWGNKRWWIDGLKYDGGNIKLGTTNFNNNASGYKTVGKYPNTGGGYVKAVAGTSEAGYVPTDLGGSSSTYYCDYGSVYDGWFPAFGGYRSDGSFAGGFSLDSYFASSSDSSLGSRLFMYGK